MAYKDLSTFLQQLEKEREMVQIDEEVSPVFEAAAILKQLGQTESPAVLFKNISGYATPVAGNVFGTRTRLAIALETTKDKLNEKYLEAKKHSTPPVSVTEGSAKEVLVTEKIDIPALIPALTHHRKDKSPYFTQAISFMRHPQTGTPTMGIHRMEVKGGNRLGIYLGSRTSTEYLRLAEEKNAPLEVAIVLGVDPAMLLASAAWFPYGDKIGLAGSLRGEPVELIKAETVDLEIPAHAAVNGSPKARRWAGRLKIAAPLTNIFLVTAECWGHGGPSGLSFLRRERSVSRYETMDRYTAEGTEGRNKQTQNSPRDRYALDDAGENPSV